MEKKYEFRFNLLEVSSILCALDQEKAFYEKCYDDIEEYPATAAAYHRVCDLIEQFNKIL